MSSSPVWVVTVSVYDSECDGDDSFQVTTTVLTDKASADHFLLGALIKVLNKVSDNGDDCEHPEDYDSSDEDSEEDGSDTDHNWRRRGDSDWELTPYAKTQLSRITEELEPYTHGDDGIAHLVWSIKEHTPISMLSKRRESCSPDDENITKKQRM